MTLRCTFAALVLAAVTVQADVKITDPLYREDAVCDYLIVVPDNGGIRAEMERLARSKWEKGLQTRIVTVDSIARNVSGFDTQQKIRNLVKTAYREWGVTWVLFAGDFRLIPAREVCTGDYFPADSIRFLSDIYYACLDGDWDPSRDDVYGDERSETVYKLKCRFDNDSNYVCDEAQPEVVGIDLWSDVYVGRMPVSNAEEARIMVDKTLRYRDEPRRGAKANDMFMFGPKIHYRVTRDYSTGMEITDAAQYWHYELKPVLEAPGSHMRGIGIDEMYEDRVTPEGEVIGDSLDMSIEQLSRQLSNGYNFVFFSCHGEPDHIWISSRKLELFRNEHARAIRSEQFSNIMSISCKVMKMPPESTTCFAKSFLVNPDGGAVTYSGSSANDYMSSKRWHYLRATRYLAEGSVSRIAKAFQVANVRQDRYNQFVHQFWGDPELEAWTHAATGPDTFAIEIEATGRNWRVSVAPALDSVLVCLYKAGEVFERAYTKDGIASVVKIPDDIDDIVVTATMQNHLPSRMIVDASDVTPTGIRRPQPGAVASSFSVAVDGRRIALSFAPGSVSKAWLCDIAGRTVDRMPEGLRTNTWSVDRTAAGVYLLKAREGGEVRTRRVVVR